MGKFNILPQKSWHVYSKSNRERVRRDEEKARILEEEKASRTKKADIEFRINELRKDSQDQNQQHPSHISGELPALLPQVEQIPAETIIRRNTLGTTLHKQNPPWYANKQSSTGHLNDTNSLLPGDPMIAIKMHDEKVQNRRRKEKEIQYILDREESSKKRKPTGSIHRTLSRETSVKYKRHKRKEHSASDAIERLSGKSNHRHRERDDRNSKHKHKHRHRHGRRYSHEHVFEDDRNAHKEK